MNYDDAKLTEALAKLFAEPSAIEQSLGKHFAKGESLGDVIGKNFSGAPPLGISLEDWRKSCDAVVFYFEGALALAQAVRIARSKNVPEADRKYFAAAAVRLAKKIKPLEGVVRAWSLCAVNLAVLDEEISNFVDAVGEERFAARALTVLLEVEYATLSDKMGAARTH